MEWNDRYNILLLLLELLEEMVSEMVSRVVGNRNPGNGAIGVAVVCVCVCVLGLGSSIALSPAIIVAARSEARMVGSLSDRYAN